MPSQEQEAAEGEKEVTLKEVPLNRIFPDDLQTHFVNHFVLQTREDHFILTAYEAYPPIILGDDEEREKAIQKVESIDAKCVGRWILTPKNLFELSAILQKHVANLFIEDEPLNDSTQPQD